jgi:hypothetical protein
MYLRLLVLRKLPLIQPMIEKVGLERVEFEVFVRELLP